MSKKEVAVVLKMECIRYFSETAVIAMIERNAKLYEFNAEQVLQKEGLKKRKNQGPEEEANKKARTEKDEAAKKKDDELSQLQAELGQVKADLVASKKREVNVHDSIDGLADLMEQENPSAELNIAIAMVKNYERQARAAKKKITREKELAALQLSVDEMRQMYA